ncbi:25121_t:CDS:2, partial [Racocetra persica]
SPVASVIVGVVVAGVATLKVAWVAALKVAGVAALKVARVAALKVTGVAVQEVAGVSALEFAGVAALEVADLGVAVVAAVIVLDLFNTSWHLAYLCPSIKDQSHDRSLNYNVMDVRHVKVGRKKHEGLKCSRKIKMERKVDSKNRNNDEVVKRIKVNEKFAKASIRLIVQEFVKHELASDVILAMPWVMKTRCSFEWKDRKCHCSIMKNNDQKETKFVDVRCIKNKLTENDSAGEEKEKCSDGKDNNVVNVRCVVNVLEDNKAEFKYNGGEAADGRTNKSGKDYHKSKIKNEKDEQKAFRDDKNKRCIRLGGASMSHPSTIRTLNSMLKAKRNVNNFVRLNGVSCRRVKTSRKVMNKVYTSLVEGVLRIDNAKIKVMNTLRFESNESFDKCGNDPKKLDALCV